NFTSNIVLAPGQSTQLTVSSKPTSKGAKSATLSIASSAVNSPITVALSAVGGVASNSFSKSVLQNFTTQNPTSLQWGPDNRLYLSAENGTIYALTVSRNGANNYSVVSQETINLVHNIPNHDDNGAVNASVVGRLCTGIVVTGTAANPVIYVSSSDPRIG